MVPPKCWPIKNWRETLGWLAFLLFALALYPIMLCVDLYDRLRYGKPQPIPKVRGKIETDIIICKDREKQ